MMTPDTWKEMNGAVADKVRRGEATELARLFGFTFFEHPTKGDEHPILARSKSGQVFNTLDHELPEYI